MPNTRKYTHRKEFFFFCNQSILKLTNWIWWTHFLPQQLTLEIGRYLPSTSAKDTQWDLILKKQNANKEKPSGLTAYLKDFSLLIMHNCWHSEMIDRLRFLKLCFVTFSWLLVVLMNKRQFQTESLLEQYASLCSFHNLCVLKLCFVPGGGVTYHQSQHLRGNETNLVYRERCPGQAPKAT